MKPPEKSGGVVVSGVGEGDSDDTKSPSWGQLNPNEDSGTVVQIECQTEDHAKLLAECLSQLLFTADPDENPNR